MPDPTDFETWINGPPGGDWVLMDEAPRLPSDVGMPLPASAVQWWAGMPATDHILYAAVAGDAGSRGPYVVIVHCGQVGDDAPPRFPTYEEVLAVLAKACAEGAILALSTITGGEPVEPASGWRSLTLVGTGAYMEGSTAAIRAQLAAPAPRANGGLAHGN